MALFAKMEQNVSAFTQNVSSLAFHAYARLKQVQLPPLASAARQFLGIYLDRVMTPQPLGPLGPMAQGLLTTTGTQDVDLILSQAPKTNMHEVPSCCIFRVNKSTRECPLGSRNSGQRPTHFPSTSLPEFIAKQVPYPLGLYSKQEPNVMTLWPGARRMVSPTRLIVHFAKAEPISQSASPSPLKTGKLEDKLRKFGSFVQKAPRNLP